MEAAGVSAKHWAVTDGRDLLAGGSELVPAQIASITKLMTLHVCLRFSRDSGVLDERVHVSALAAGVGGTSAGLCPGDVVSFRDLLYGLMLPSGNDAASALAEYIGDYFDMPPLAHGCCAPTGAALTAPRASNAATTTGKTPKAGAAGSTPSVASPLAAGLLCSPTASSASAPASTSTTARSPRATGGSPAVATRGPLFTADGHRVTDSPHVRFVAEMNREATRLGLTSTRFANPHGLTDAHTSARQQSSATDVCRLMAAMRVEHGEEALAAICGRAVHSALVFRPAAAAATTSGPGTDVVVLRQLDASGLAKGAVSGAAVAAGCPSPAAAPAAASAVRTVFLRRSLSSPSMTPSPSAGLAGTASAPSTPRQGAGLASKPLLRVAGGAAAAVSSSSASAPSSPLVAAGQQAHRHRRRDTIKAATTPLAMVTACSSPAAAAAGAGTGSRGGSRSGRPSPVKVPCAVTWHNTNQLLGSILTVTFEVTWPPPPPPPPAAGGVLMRAGLAVTGRLSGAAGSRVGRSLIANRGRAVSGFVSSASMSTTTSDDDRDNDGDDDAGSQGRSTVSLEGRQSSLGSASSASSSDTARSELSMYLATARSAGAPASTGRGLVSLRSAVDAGAAGASPRAMLAMTATASAPLLRAPPSSLTVLIPDSGTPTSPDFSSPLAATAAAVAAVQAAGAAGKAVAGQLATRQPASAPAHPVVNPRLLPAFSLRAKQTAPATAVPAAAAAVPPAVTASTGFASSASPHFALSPLSPDLQAAACTIAASPMVLRPASAKHKDGMRAGLDALSLAPGRGLAPTTTAGPATALTPISAARAVPQLLPVRNPHSLISPVSTVGGPSPRSPVDVSTPEHGHAVVAQSAAAAIRLAPTIVGSKMSLALPASLQRQAGPGDSAAAAALSPREALFMTSAATARDSAIATARDSRCVAEDASALVSTRQSVVRIVSSSLAAPPLHYDAEAARSSLAAQVAAAADAAATGVSRRHLHASLPPYSPRKRTKAAPAVTATTDSRAERLPRASYFPFTSATSQSPSSTSAESSPPIAPQPARPAARLCTLEYIFDGAKTGATPIAGGCLVSTLTLVGARATTTTCNSARGEPPSSSCSDRSAAIDDVLGGGCGGSSSGSGSVDVTPALLARLPPHLVVTVLGSRDKHSRFTDTRAVAEQALVSILQQRCS